MHLGVGIQQTLSISNIENVCIVNTTLDKPNSEKGNSNKIPHTLEETCSLVGWLTYE